MKSRPQTPPELRSRLLAIFPSVPRDFASSGESVFADAQPTFPSVLRNFAEYFAKDIDQFSDRQLKRFAELLAACTAVAGPLQDAIETGLLEDLRRAKVHDRLQPFLSAARSASRVD